MNGGTFDREWEFKEAGEATLRIAVRGDATKLDAIFVTSNIKAAQEGAADVRLPTKTDINKQEAGLAVSPKDKIATTWGKLKKQYQ